MIPTPPPQIMKIPLKMFGRGGRSPQVFDPSANTGSYINSSYINSIRPLGACMVMYLSLRMCHRSAEEEEELKKGLFSEK